MNKHLINLVVGDWSHDGHEKTKIVTIETNAPHEMIRTAYNKGCEIVGFDLKEDIASGYEDRTLSNDRMKSLVIHGYDESRVERAEFSNEEKDYAGDYVLNDDSFVDIWLFLVKLGNSEITYETVSINSIAVGGYGLFY